MVVWIIGTTHSVIITTSSIIITICIVISKPIAWFDRHVVDGFFDFLAWGTNALGYQIRGLQSGSVQKYAFVFLLGIIILLLIMIL